MNTADAVMQRKSVRTFTDAPLRGEDAERILAFSSDAGNPYGLAVEFRLLSAREHGLSSPVIVGADTYLAGKMKREAHAEEAFGFSFERVLLFAQTLGVSSVWIAGTLDRPAFERAAEVREGEVMPCVSPLGYAAEKRSLRELMMRKSIRADTRLPFGDLFFDGSFDTPLTEARAGALQGALELVRRAPSAVNRQPWRVVVTDGAAHFYEKRSRGYTDHSGWDIQKIDMGIALCHFSLGAEAAGLNISFSLEDPALPAPPDTAYAASFLLT